MKLFYHIFGYLLFGMIILIVTDEYLSFHEEVKQFEADMVTNAVQNGNSISGMIAHVWRESGEQKALELIRDASNSGTIDIRWVWADSFPDNSMMAGSDKKQLEKLTLQETTTLKIHDKRGEIHLYTYVPVDIGLNRIGALELRQSFTALELYSGRMLIRAIIITALLAVICGVILYLFINNKIRVPLNRLTRQAKRIGQGDLRVETDIVGNDELADLARTMNDMCSSLIIAKDKIKFEYDARLKTLDQLRHTERLSTFGLISAGIAHEIGTPLNVVDGRAKMIINEDLRDEEIKECAAIIKSQAERMTLIIRQLLDFTRRPKQHISQENIAFLVKQIFQLLHPMASRQHVSFSFNRSEDAEVELSVDGSQIQQVLINLLMNSVQAMPNGGTVSVSITNEMLKAPLKADQQPQKYIKVRIVDEGEGICQEDIEHIFTPFYTTKTVGTGTGLGLSIAHGIVEEHSGWIDVENSIRNGACFSVYLPMKENE
ncbi:sensor histidine kinase [Desulfosediminicola sp.]|uniref:sensor histidine kinase n=1 Tax=Desulfosediminicola sp. TaxID=2886825 RepID=UPI003AF22DD0